MPVSNIVCPSEDTAASPQGQLKTSPVLFELTPTVPPQSVTLTDGTEVVVSPMKREDYPEVRAVMPKVSRCSEVFDEDAVNQLLSLPTFFPFIGRLQGGELVCYAELHRLPHLGRGFDGRIEKVLVVEDMRGKKLAQSFCAFLINLARSKFQCGRIDLTVEQPDAKKVYGNLGFTKVDTEVWRLML